MGSEMCIRDSLWGGGHARIHDVGAACRCLALAPLDPPRLPPPDTPRLEILIQPPVNVVCIKVRREICAPHAVCLWRKVQVRRRARLRIGRTRARGRRRGAHTVWRRRRRYICRHRRSVTAAQGAPGHEPAERAQGTALLRHCCVPRAAAQSCGAALRRRASCYRVPSAAIGLCTLKWAPPPTRNPAAPCALTKGARGVCSAEDTPRQNNTRTGDRRSEESTGRLDYDANAGHRRSCGRT